jgi:hypothetical protein
MRLRIDILTFVLTLLVMVGGVIWIITSAGLAYRMFVVAMAIQVLRVLFGLGTIRGSL